MRGVVSILIVHAAARAPRGPHRLRPSRRPPRRPGDIVGAPLVPRTA